MPSPEEKSQTLTLTTHRQSKNVIAAHSTAPGKRVKYVVDENIIVVFMYYCYSVNIFFVCTFGNTLYAEGACSKL